MKDLDGAVPLPLAGLATGQSRGRYLAGIVLAVAGVMLLGTLIFLPLLAMGGLERLHPYIGSYALLAANSMAIPVLAVIVGAFHRRPFMDLIAPGRRFDAGMLGRSALVFAVPLLVQVGIGFHIGELRRGDTDLSLFLMLLPVSVLLFALQASAEELLFRGYLAQGLQVILRHGAPAALIGALLFTLAHEGAEARAVWEQRAGIMAMALFLSWTTWRFGRLEAAMGVHIVNNVLFSVFIGGGAFSFPDLTTLVDPDPPDFQGLADLGEFALHQAVTLGFYWLAGVKTGFVERGLSPRQA